MTLNTSWSLPTEISFRTLSMLPKADLASCCLVSQQFEELAKYILLQPLANHTTIENYWQTVSAKTAKERWHSLWFAGSPQFCQLHPLHEPLPLQLARQGDIATLDWLRRLGANIKVKAKDRRNILDIAVLNIYQWPALFKWCMQQAIPQSYKFLKKPAPIEYLLRQEGEVVLQAIATLVLRTGLPYGKYQHSLLHLSKGIVTHNLELATRAYNYRQKVLRRQYKATHVSATLIKSILLSPYYHGCMTLRRASALIHSAKTTNTFLFHHCLEEGHKKLVFSWYQGVDADYGVGDMVFLKYSENTKALTVDSDYTPNLKWTSLAALLQTYQLAWTDGLAWFDTRYDLL